MYYYSCNKKLYFGALIHCQYYDSIVIMLHSNVN